MRKIWNKIMIAGIVGLSLGINGCEDAANDVIDNGLYFTEAALGPTKKLLVDDQGGKTSVSVRLAHAIDQKVTVKLHVDSVLIEKYNKRNGTSYAMLPAAFYEFEKMSAEIEAGRVSSLPIELIVKPLSQELTNAGIPYAIPVSIVEVNGPVSTIGTTKDFLILLDQVIVTSVPKMNYNNKTTFNVEKDYKLNTWSFEMRVNMDRLGKNVGELNNQAILNAGSDPWTAENEIYARFGDAPIEGNRLQVKVGGTQVETQTLFSENTWYHLAFVFDGTMFKIYVNGKLDASTEPKNKMFTIQNIDIVSSGSYFRANAMMHELRFWTIPVSEAHIQNNQFVVNPQTEGLEGYWKMNEGEGNVFHDITGHGMDGTVPGKLTWIEGIRSDGK